MFRFAGFELDQQRNRLRGPDGETIKLRPRTFDMLVLFAASAGRVLGKQELIEAVWPDVHVAEDSLFQCIREIRTALGDDRRQMIRLVSGRGYRFEAEVSIEPDGTETQAPLSPPAAGPELAASAATLAGLARPWRPFGWRGPAALAAVAGLGVIFGLAVAAPIASQDFVFGRPRPTIVVMPIAGVGNDSLVADTAANVTSRLIDGLAKIDSIRVVTPTAPQPASTRATQADLAVTGELVKGERSWELRARMIRTATGEVVWTAPVSVGFKTSDPEEADLSLQQSRLAAGLGHPLALRINALLDLDARPAVTVDSSTQGSARVAIEQAIASINQTTRERFAAAQTMLDNALAGDPDNTDLQVAIAALQLRGIQLGWLGLADRPAAEEKAKAMLERALRAKPNHIPVLEAYCRVLTASNRFVESLVACTRALSFDPWNGLVLYHIGLAQLQLGRFDDALVAFKQADRFDTPQASRWAWLAAAGWTCILMDRAEEALPWLQRSIAITSASGRTHMLLAAAYQRLDRPDEAKAALAKGLELRPGTTALNVAPPTRNASPIFLEASPRVIQSMVEAGLPER